MPNFAPNSLAYSVVPLKGHSKRKVLLKLSSLVKFSQNLTWNEDDSNSTTPLIYPCHVPVIWLFDIVDLVWAIVLSVPKAMREPENEIRQYVPTPFFIVTAYP